MHEIDKQKFGAFVAQLRKEKGYTQKELAKQLFISDKAVSKWETGVSIPDTALLLPLAELLGVTVTELLLYRKQVPNETMEQETIEQVVQTAVWYGEDRPQRAWQEKKGLWPLWYILCLLVGAMALWIGYRHSVWMDAVWTVAILGAVFGAYFVFFARTKLLEFYDQYKMGMVYDGIFRMNVPGLTFSNRNWPYIVAVGRVWSCAVMLLMPLLALGLTAIDAALWVRLQLPLTLLLTLGGLFVPMYVVGKRYE